MTLGPGKPWGSHGEAMGICWGYVMTYGIWDVNGDMSWDVSWGYVELEMGKTRGSVVRMEEFKHMFGISRGYNLM